VVVPVFGTECGGARRFFGTSGKEPGGKCRAEQGEAAARRPLPEGLPSRSPKTRSARLPLAPDARTLLCTKTTDPPAYSDSARAA
jgi:hypothetical protein